MKRLAFIALLAACGGGEETTTAEIKTDEKQPDDKKADPKPEEAKDSEARKALVASWAKAGLETKDLKPAKAFGKDCKLGTVNGVEVAVCDQGSADDAKKLEPQGLAWVGETTGAAWSSGSLVIAVADRKKTDTNGRTINKLMKSSPK